jgi:hypothetical protein
MSKNSVMTASPKMKTQKRKKIKTTGGLCRDFLLISSSLTTYFC